MENIDRFALSAVVSVAGMHQIIRFAIQVGASRGKHGVKAPITDGPDEFVRTYRAHQNALESYTLSMSGLWLGSVFLHPVPSSLLYAGYLFGRERSFWGYIEKAEFRLQGLWLSYGCLQGLMALALVGAGNRLLRHHTNVDIFKMIGGLLPICKD